MTPKKENCCYSNWNVFTAFRSHGNQRIDESVKTTRKMADVNKRWCKDNTGWKNFQYARGQLNSGENIKKEREKEKPSEKKQQHIETVLNVIYYSHAAANRRRCCAAEAKVLMMMDRAGCCVGWIPRAAVRRPRLIIGGIYTTIKE